jgi:predicted AlkP superfamily pyrophosphatase or phosphodiesterase
MRTDVRQTRFSLLVASIMLATATAWGGPKVMFISVDGCRPDALQAANTPNLDALISAGAVSYTSHTVATPYTHSGPGYASMLTGVDVPKHKVTANDFSPYDLGHWPTLFHRIEAANPALYTASFVNWSPINSGLHIDAVADEVYTSTNDASVASQAANLLSTGNPDLMFVELEGVDVAGHSYGFSPTVPQYLQAIQQADQNLGTVFNALRSRPGYNDGTERWLIIATADHGGGPGTNHDGGEASERTFMIVGGPAVPAGTDLGSPRIFDAPVTALEYLGVNTQPLNLDGHVMAIPEPSSLTLLGAGLLAVAGLAWRRSRRG